MADIQFIPKEQGIQTLEERYNDTDLVDSLGGVNPLPDMYSITAIDANQVSTIAAEVAEIEGVYEVQYGEGTVEKLLTLTHAVRKFGYAVMGLLAVCAVVLIAMATRLTIQTRKKEIMVMNGWALPTRSSAGHLFWKGCCWVWLAQSWRWFCYCCFTAGCPYI